MFNAIQYTEELKKAGFSADQADVSVKILIDVMNENFATKTDIADVRSEIKDLRAELRSEIASVRTEIKDVRTELKTLEVKMDSGFRELEYKLMIKLGSMMGAMMTVAVGMTATIVKLLQSSH